MNLCPKTHGACPLTLDIQSLCQGDDFTINIIRPRHQDRIPDRRRINGLLDGAEIRRMGGVVIDPPSRRVEGYVEDKAGKKKQGGFHFRWMGMDG
jgi:hypothetical protein